MKIEEEYNSLLTKVPNWSTQERQKSLQSTIGILLSNEPTMEELLENDLEISKATLLELTLTNMKNETIKFAKRTKIRDDHTDETLKEELQELICEDIDDTNLEEIHAKQEELGAFEELKLFNILSKKKNFLLLDDERPT